MSRDASVTFTWAGDERTFRLAIKEALALEDRRDCGLAEIAGRLSSARWRIDDIREPLRLGLIGAGLDAAKARKLVEDNVVPGRLAEHVLAARAVLMASLVGDPNEPVGKEEAAEETGESPPPASTEPVAS
ncbi:gene transfer agent family protein [Kaustia mangrovi]|uniref:Gene transfer agent family protein n=1 Tax=Kaustia mangrovi TaxID=2593653 RepID=A0A7S8C517_9HYPH|nr:gene transfer agent family protein [Kaustia mangrovi]QPC43488.1 gene transfer agent family protein [Kaustia mangrovi]